MITIYKQALWYVARFDGRRKEFKGVNRAQFKAAQAKHWQRAANRPIEELEPDRRCESIKIATYYSRPDIKRSAYAKRLYVIGNDICLCSVAYGAGDYNATRIWAATSTNLRKAIKVNNIIDTTI